VLRLLKIFKMQEQRSGVQSTVSAGQQHHAEERLREHLELHLSGDDIVTFEELSSECAESEMRSDHLRKALDFSQAQRMLQLLAQQMDSLQQVADQYAQQAAAARSKVCSSPTLSIFCALYHWYLL
jgi:hypothetical protein